VSSRGEVIELKNGVLNVHLFREVFLKHILKSKRKGSVIC